MSLASKTTPLASSSLHIHNFSGSGLLARASTVEQDNPLIAGYPIH